MGYEFEQVLGGVLGAVAEARSLADRVSRELALEYEGDELLRVFPVPRMEFEKVDVDFKFALEATDEQTDPDRTAVQQKAENLVTASALRVRSTVVEHLGKLEQDGYLKVPEYFDYAGFGYAVEYDVRGVIHDPTLVAATTPPDQEITLKTFDLDRIVGLVIEWLNKRVEMESEPVMDYYYNLLKPIQGDHEQGVLQVRELLLNLTTPGKFPMRVLMRHQDLTNIPVQSISSLKLTVNVRNYEWTKVDEVDGVAVRKLIPE